MKRILSFLLTLLIFCSACAAPPPQGLPQNPQKVAVLFSSLAELWQLAGGEIAITVGESIERGFCTADTPLVDRGAGKTIDTERLLALQPDFVIGSADLPAHQEAELLLKEAKIPCLLLRLESFADYLAALEQLCALTGDATALEASGAALQRSIDATLAAAEVQPSKKILFIRSGSSTRSAKAKTADQHFAAMMLQELGAANIADQAPLLLEGLSLEAILNEDPDCIFIAPMGNEAAAKAYMESVLRQPAWRQLKAVKEQQVTYLPKDLFQYKPNARWAEAYQYLYKALYQE